jgi:putative transcriptional regulator
MSFPTIPAAARALFCTAALVIATPVPGVMAADMASGIFLIAKHQMKDPRFRETVLLVTQPRQGGPFGVIVNRPLDHRLSELFPGQAKFSGRKDVLFLGGPVSTEGIVFLVRTAVPPARAVHVLKDVYFTADAKWIETLLKRSDPTQGLRVYAGYAGWAPGQLQNELQRGDWYVLPADAETIFEKEPAQIWPELIKRATARPTRAEPRELESAGASQGI